MAELSSSALSDRLFFFDLDPDEQKHFKEENPSIVAMWELAESLPGLPLGFRRYLYDINTWKASHLQRKCLSGAPHRERLANRFMPTAIESKKKNLCIARLYYLDLSILERFGLEYAEFHREKAQSIDSLRRHIEFPLSFLINSDPFSLYVNRQMVEKPVILCTHCDTSAMSFGSVNKFHEHFKEHGILTAYGCHRCLHLFHTREMWEQHRKETCKENSTDDPLSASLYAIACVGCGFMYVYNPQVFTGAVSGRQLGDLMRIQNCHCWDEMVMFRLVTTENEDDLLSSEVHVEPRRWTGVTYLHEKHATCRNICGIERCGVKSSSFSDHIVHTEQHCGSQRIQFQFVNFLNELVDLNPTVKNELNWRRRRARAYPKSIRKLKSEGPGERKMPGGALHAFTVSFDPNPVLPGISKTFSRVSLCRQCQTLTIGSEPALSHAKYCYKDQSISPDEICYSDKYATNIWDFQHLPNDRGTCPVVKCRHRACSIHGFVVHMLTKHGVQVTQNLSLLKKYEEDDREDYMLSRPCLKSMEINQKCLLTYDGHFPIEGNTWSKVDYTPEDLFCKEDGAVDLSVAVTIQEIGDKEETLAIDKNVYKSKPVEEERVPNQPPTSREPIVLKIDRHLLGASYLRKDSTSRPRPSVVPDQIPIKKKKRTEEERQKRKRDKNLVANIEAMPRAETDRGPSEEIRAAQKAECDEAIKRHRQDPILYNFKRQCFDCGLIMKDEASLQNHLKEHNPMDLNPLNFSCPFCDVKLDDMPSYYEHMYRIHSKPNFDLTKTVSPICCSLCENGRNYETLVPHLRFECTYAKNCGICKYKLHEMKDGKVQLFKSSQRDKHMKKHQEHFKRFACLCGQDFPHFVLYANHVCEKKEEKKIVTIRLSLKLFQNIVSPDEVVKWIIKQRSASRPSTSATNENAAQAVTTKGSSERLIEKSTALNGLTSFTEPTLKRRREESTFRMPERPSPSVTVLDMNPPSVVCLNPPPSIICLDQPDPYGPIPPTNQNVTNREIIGADEISLGPSSSKDDDDIVFCEAVANSKLSTAKSVAEEDDEIMICEPSEPIKKQAREKNHKCAYCSQSFYTERSLELHKKFSHEEDVSTTTKRIFGTYGIPVGRDLFFCPNCMYAFENPTTHLDHMAGHIKGIVICDYCSGTSGSRQMMIKHLSTSGHGLAPASIDPERETDTTVLPIPGEFWCTECSPSLVFATDSSLFLHLIMDHGQQLFYFCKKCLFGNTNMSHVLQHIQMGICGIERQIYERTLGCVLAKSLHFHPEDEDQHKRYLSLEENRNKFMTPNDCPRRGTIRFSTRMSTCHEVHEDGQKCFNPMNFFHYENHLIQVNNYYVAESACLPDRLLPRRVYVDPKWNLFKWIEKKNNLGPKQISIDKWPDTTAKHYPRPGNQVPIGAHTLIFHKPNVMVAAALPQPRVQFQQQLNIMAHPHPYINSQQMMTEQQVRILHHLAQQQRYQQQQAQEQGQPSTEMIQQQAPQQSHLQAMLAQNGRGAWQGPPPGGMVRMNPPPGYQHHAQQGPMMQQVAQPNMRPGQMMQQQNQYAGMPQQALSGQCQPRQHPQSAAQVPQPQQPNAARPPQSRQQSVHIQPSTSQAQEPHQSVQQVQTTPDGVPLQPVIDREVSTCAVCNKVTPNCLLVGLLKLKARQECINSVLVTTPQALPLQEKKDISLRLKSLNSVCFKHVNPWGVQIVAGKFCTQEPKALSYVFADSFSPALKSQFYDILLNAEIYKLRRNEIDLATFLKRLRAGTQCNMESCQTILKTSVEAHLHSFHSRLEDDNRTIHLCAICKKEYRTEEDMLHHIMLNHALSRRGQDVPFELMCPVCGVISLSTDFLETHLLQQHSMFSSSCRCVFANLAAKGQHERKHHSAQSSRCCLLCGECDVFEPFKCKSLVVTHAHVHGLDCKYTCRVCFESAESHSQLAEHCRQVHRIDVRCELCNVNLSADQRADHVALRHELRLYNLRHEFKVTTPPDMREVLGLS